MKKLVIWVFIVILLSCTNSKPTLQQTRTPYKYTIIVRGENGWRECYETNAIIIEGGLVYFDGFYENRTRSYIFSGTYQIIKN